ncbi:uncharacterized protein N7515_000729 [Penicillium bovifimosum]|uniref:Uncharacterized protein n=1 Tax=Penicillium bovifimosum TaxID=126998 RepID=A0A9W9HFY2_9EURO|nr:uncharacterized protein N7515_000729 [Penicillium bovifimosum]KAJ5146165.1 hypothetical protein N7515_000729 [Penicillium bovifimosum]
MSDDDEYYEFEDDYMYEDLVPDLVDDLAASSYYEANLYEDPGNDGEDYFSDWDYYSDDYYDDDATAERSAERKKRADLTAREKRRTKTSSDTSLQTTAIPPTKSTLMPDITSFQGVVWKTPALDRNLDVSILYEPDTGDKVALLQNWREIFKSVQPALDKSRLKRRPVEESMTVDSLSLEDNDMYDGDSDDEPDSSDEMSDVPSLCTSGVDGGDASNTTPDAEPDSVRSSRRATPPKVVISTMRGRKRKAAGQQDEPDEDTAPPRSKRVESRKGGGNAAKKPAAPPVRRSTRQKK